eukprot:GDKI01007106.1.p1 GENE.GDKI01007106.1~~GDKI01007106.1.p1  ORF type:complete len:678 (-),score=256.43 GDKI01007106.1:433-2466(-)
MTEASGLLAGEDASHVTKQQESTMTFSNVAGVILEADKERFARTLFRASRGNAFTQFYPIEEQIRDPKSNLPVRKTVFVVYYQGSQASALFDKISKICKGFEARTYRWPVSQAEARGRLSALEETLEDKARALNAYETYFMGEIGGLLEVKRSGGNSLLEEWRMFCLKEKSIYATLNMFEGDITLRANCWYPEAEEDKVNQLLTRQSNQQHVNAFLIPDKSGKLPGAPPTYIRVNEFTAPFQELVNTYGVPRYKEANPALFACVLFPFLFGIMYGDIGHASFILAFGLWMCFSYEKMKPSLSGGMKSIFEARYLLTLSGFFALYAGFMYNDFLSVAFNIFGARFEESDVHIAGNVEYKMVDNYRPYPFGLDPSWHGASNELMFINSMKMKFAVIVGVLHMCLGVCMKGFNAIHFGSPLDFCFEFLPQITFLTCTFGYMDWMVIYKWLGDQSYPKPGLVTTMIEMFMPPFTPMEPLYEGQQEIQTRLLLIAVACVPLMLIPKPLILYIWHSNNAKTRHEIDSAAHEDEERGSHGNEGGHGGGHGDHEEFDIGEITIHQIIETIEFVLGSVSNTASYLRLWALSLAHQQLSLVFFNLTVVQNAFSIENFIVKVIMIFCMFAVFMGITFGVMLAMDAMECFLHALRLQWVEFQNKFYKGDGYKFAPFNHKNLLEAANNEE